MHRPDESDRPEETDEFDAFDELSDAEPVDDAEKTAEDDVEDAPEKPARRQGQRRGALAIGLLLALVVVGVAGAAVHMYPSGTAAGGAHPSVSTSASVEPTMTAADRDQIAAEHTVIALYSALNASDTAAARSLVTTDTQNAVDVGVFRQWSYTTFQVARSVIETDTAFVFGHESQRQLGAKTLGVKFTLQRVGGRWLIKGWDEADEGLVKGAEPSSGQAAGPIALDEVTSKDIVSTLLQARQVGDTATIEILTTARFQAANAENWLDGVNREKIFTAFTIATVKKKGSTYYVTTKEDWGAGVETGTYGVVIVNGTILVDTWSMK